jgi:magnesium-transporting ATPase (P-type)
MASFPRALVGELHEISDLAGRATGSRRRDVLPKAERLFSGLRSDVETGCATDSLKERREIFGTNSMPKPPTRTFFSMVFAAASDPTMIALTVAAVIALVLGLLFPEQTYVADCNCVVADSSGWIEGVAILVAVAVVVLATAIQDFDKELKFRALHKFDVRFCTVSALLILWRCTELARSGRARWKVAPDPH